jgi:predicted Mrr-cat superfamily restriction endonuclease
MLSSPVADRSTAGAIWVIRGGRQGQLLDTFLSGSFVGIDVPGVGDVTSLTTADVTERLVGSGMTEGKATGLAAVLDSLATRVQAGDIVITPEKGSAEYRVGLITGSYEFAHGIACAHRRKVRWLGALGRDEIPDSFRRTLGSPMPLYRPAAQDKLDVLIRQKWPNARRDDLR